MLKPDANDVQVGVFLSLDSEDGGARVARGNGVASCRAMWRVTG
jgi:hypothetical protein